MYSYNLPDENNNPVPYTTNNNSIIIIGANGSGKSKLGAWMESKDWNNVHRISAQRSLIFGNYIPLKSYEQAENTLFYGDEEKNATKGRRWNWGKTTTTLLDDFEKVLTTLMALNNLQTYDFFIKCKEAERLKNDHPKTPITVIDTLENIWDEVFPQRKLNISDSKVMAMFEKIENGTLKKLYIQAMR